MTPCSETKLMCFFLHIKMDFNHTAFIKCAWDDKVFVAWCNSFVAEANFNLQMQRLGTHTQHSAYMSKDLQCNWEREIWPDTCNQLSWLTLQTHQNNHFSKPHPESVHMDLLCEFWLQGGLCTMVCKGNIQRAMKAVRRGQITGGHVEPQIAGKETCSPLGDC